VLITALGSAGGIGPPRSTDGGLDVDSDRQRRKGDPLGWCAVLLTALGSWGKPVPSGLLTASMKGRVIVCL
jgi:hypothetical protein